MLHKTDYTATDFAPIPIRLYLESRGWVPLPTKRDRMILFRHPAEKYAQFYLPMETDAPGFLRGIEEIIYHLVKFEKRPESDIITNLMFPDYDIVRYRICAGRVDHGMLPLSKVNQLTKSVVRSLTAAVCDVVSPKRHHLRLQLKESDIFLDNAQFAQTERGSYVFKVLCPLDSLDPPKPTLCKEKTIPLVRRVTLHLMTTTAKLISLIELGQEDQFIEQVKQDITKERVSADFCRALADIQIWDDISLELSTQWAPLLENKEAPDRVEIKKGYFSPMLKIADAIMPSIQEQIPEVLLASVEKCDGDENDVKDRAGLVVLKILNNEDGIFKANAMLTPEQYKIANDVHMKPGKYCLKLEGKIYRKSRSCDIVEIAHLSKLSLINSED